jgi:hypothetical protein
MTITTSIRPATRPSVWARLADAAEAATSRLGDRLAVAEDTTAAAVGLHVIRTPWGGRLYRHPGFTAGAHRTRTDEGVLS